MLTKAINHHRCYQEKVVTFQETQLAEVLRVLLTKVTLEVTATQRERLNLPLKANSQPRIGLVWKVMTKRNQRKMTHWKALNFWVALVEEMGTVAEEDSNRHHLEGEVQMSITVEEVQEVEEVLHLFNEAGGEVTEEGGLAIEAEDSLLGEEVLCSVEEAGVYPNLQLVQQ